MRTRWRYRRRGRSFGGSAQFSPLTLSPTVWLDAGLSPLFQNSNGTTAAVADADPVGYWGDLSGNGNHLVQATAGKRPTLKLAIQNSLPVIRFDGVDDFLKKAFTLVQPVAGFIVYKIRTFTAGNVDMDGGIAQMALRENLVDGVTLITDFGSEGNVVIAGVADGNFHIISGLWSEVVSGSSTIQMDAGTPDTGDAGGATAPGGLTLGSYTGGDAIFGAIDIASIVLYQTPPSAANATLVRDYLKTRWGTP